MSVNIHEFAERFNREYKFLYDHNDMVAGYNEALKEGDKFIAEHGDFVGEFVKYRGDFISSDREVVAFMFALNEMTSQKTGGLTMEKWKVFYHGEKELGAYTLEGSFDGEEEATKELFASENDITVEDIKVVVEDR